MHFTASTSGLLCEKDINFTVFWDETLWWGRNLSWFIQNINKSLPNLMSPHKRKHFLHRHCHDRLCFHDIKTGEINKLRYGKPSLPSWWMSRTIHALLLYAFMACTGIILMILKLLSPAGGRPPEGNKNCIKICLWEMSRKSQLRECCWKRENAITKDLRKVVLKMRSEMNDVATHNSPFW